MLNSNEQRAWDDFTQHYMTETAAPRKRGGDTEDRPPRWYHKVPLPFVGVLLLCLLLLFQGAVLAGFALAAANAPVWLLWRFWPELLDDATASAELRAKLADDRRRGRRAKRARRRAAPGVRRNETGPPSPGGAPPSSRIPPGEQPGAEGKHP